MQTSWFVFTGTPCAGKTTTLNMLKALNHQTNPEMMADYIAEIREKFKFKKDADLFEHLKDQSVTNEALRRRLDIEKKLEPTQTIIFDRSMLDTLAYFRLNKSNLNQTQANQITEHANQYRYRAIFLFDLLPMEFDGKRHEDEEQRRFLDLEFYRIYTRFAYQVIRIAVDSKENRLASVLKLMNDLREVPSIPKELCKVYPTIFVVDINETHDDKPLQLVCNHHTLDQSVSLTPAFLKRREARASFASDTIKSTHSQYATVYGFFKIDLSHAEQVSVIEETDIDQETLKKRIPLKEYREQFKKPLYLIERPLADDEIMTTEFGYDQTAWVMNGFMF